MAAIVLPLSLKLHGLCGGIPSGGVRVRCYHLRRRILETGTLKRTTCCAATESSKSSNQLDLRDEPRILLEELADCFALPGDYLRQLPSDLRLELNDAAFDLSNGSVKDEVGEELGEILLNISQAWELADTSASAESFRKLPVITESLTSYNRSALGKRLVSASRRFQSMGQYGRGELPKIAKVMNMTGTILSSGASSQISDDEPKHESRVLKFGELQVELTDQKAYLGAVIGFVFGVLSWKIGEGIQSIPEDSLEYANANALAVAKSLRGALLVLFYASAVLSGVATVGLVLLGRQLKAEDDK